MPTATDNMAEKTDVKTLRASFSPGTNIEQNYSHLLRDCFIMSYKDVEEVIYMAGVKQQVIQMIQTLPEEVSVDDIMAELFFKLQVDAGLKELDEGKGIPHEEVEKRMSKWLTA